MAPELPQAQPQSADSSEERETENTESVETTSTDVTIERLIEQRIESRTAELEEELAELERQVEEIEDFAKISLNERKIKQSEVNLSEFSDSLSNFAEKAFNNINAIEERLNVQALLLAAILDSLSEQDIDLDLSEVERQQEDSVVMEQSPEERLESAIERF